MNSGGGGNRTLGTGVSPYNGLVTHRWVLNHLDSTLLLFLTVTNRLIGPVLRSSSCQESKASNICRVFDLFRDKSGDEELVFVTMEFRRGETLAELLRRTACEEPAISLEDMSTTDAAEVLEITEDNVKVRLHRARALLRKSLYARAGMERKEAFNFHAVRCDRVVKNVFERIQKHNSKMDNSAPSMQ